MFRNWPQDVAKQIHDRLHVAQRRVCATLRQPVILPQGLQLAVAGGHRIKKPLGQPQSAETPAADGGYPKPFPLRFQHLVQIVFQIE